MCVCACVCVGDLVWACVHSGLGGHPGCVLDGCTCVYKGYCVSRAHGVYLADLQAWR